MSNNIKGNHIRHTQEALEDIFEGLKKQDIPLLSYATDQLIAFGLGFENNNNHEFECIMVDYQVPTLPNEDYVIAWKRAKVLQAYLDNEIYDKNGDLWDDMVDELLMSLYNLLEKKHETKALH